MAGEEALDAWCPRCQEVRRHDITGPGSCKCRVCGHVEQLAAPLDPSHPR
ncbi:MAG: hypothetical protein V4510_08765 [bacterium]